jgi:hypothetical protein
VVQREIRRARALDGAEGDAAAAHHDDVAGRVLNRHLLHLLLLAAALLAHLLHLMCAATAA